MSKFDGISFGLGLLAGGVINEGLSHTMKRTNLNYETVQNPYETHSCFKSPEITINGKQFKLVPVDSSDSDNNFQKNYPQFQTSHTCQGGSSDKSYRDFRHFANTGVKNQQQKSQMPCNHPPKTEMPEEIKKCFDQIHRLENQIKEYYAK